MHCLSLSPIVFSLWASDTLPTEKPSWHLLETGEDRCALELRAKGLSFLFNSRRFSVVQGDKPPYWQPKA